MILTFCSEYHRYKCPTDGMEYLQLHNDTWTHSQYTTLSAIFKGQLDTKLIYSALTCTMNSWFDLIRDYWIRPWTHKILLFTKNIKILRHTYWYLFCIFQANRKQTNRHRGKHYHVAGDNHTRSNGDYTIHTSRTHLTLLKRSHRLPKWNSFKLKERIIHVDNTSTITHHYL